MVEVYNNGSSLKVGLLIRGRADKLLLLRM